MSTTAQRAANRANSLKSTGPRTDTGKSRSSLNALKHGCTAQTLIFTGDDATHFHNFHQSIVQDLAPVGALETAMVQEIAHAQWSIARTRAHETNLFALGHEKHAESIQTGGDLAVQAAFAAALSLKFEGNTVKNVGLYLQRQNRIFLATLKALRDIQAERKTHEQAHFDEAVHFADLNARLPNPVELKDLGFVYSPEELAPRLLQLALLRTAETPQKSPPKPEIHVTNAA